MQSTLIAGDSLSIPDVCTDYPATDGWTLKYSFVPLNPTSAVITLSASANGADYLTEALPNTTKNWVPGKYTWTKWVEKSNARHTLESGQITITPDPSAMAAGTDTRSHVERTLANLEAMLEGKATKDVQEYTIADRQLKYMTIAELLHWRDKYQAQLAAERAAKKSPFGRGRKIYVRF